MTVVRYLHLVAMAFFVGGQLFLVAAVVPSFRSRPDRESRLSSSPHPVSLARRPSCPRLSLDR
jgi:hypothetical protein